jgi:molybdopterin synthase catalytic subunit
LEYDAYEEMAERILGELVGKACRQWDLEEVKLLHRLGRVELGEIAVAIAVESAHRNEAYQASRFLIEEIKHTVPIWKKEYFADGTSEWSLCSPTLKHSTQP